MELAHPGLEMAINEQMASLINKLTNLSVYTLPVKPVDSVPLKGQ
jgi:hypothetical protein